MAGGTFDLSVGKVRPGTYINFESQKTETVTGSGRGTVLLPLINHKYGPEKELIELTASAPDASYSKLGYSVYDSDSNMIMIREAFKNASKVIAYIPKQGAKSTKNGGGVVGTAKYGGSRGNDFSYAIVANPVGGFDVKISIGGSPVELFEGLTTVAQLIAAGSEYITFVADGEATNLTAVAGVTLVGGADGVAQNEDISAFLDASESVSWNAMAFPSTDSSLHTACKTKIKYLRESVGKKVKAAVPNFDADYEGIINVTNSVKIDDVSLSVSQVTAWVAGADAAASNVESNTYKIYTGATEIISAKIHEEAVAAIQNGEFFFSYSDAGDIVVEYDINSLVTFTSPKDSTYRKNRVIRVFDTFAEAVSLNFPPNRFDNSPDDWEVMEGLGKKLLKQFGPKPDGVGAIKNIDYDNDFKVDQSLSEGDKTYFNIGIQAVDSSEKQFFTIATS